MTSLTSHVSDISSDQRTTDSINHNTSTSPPHSTDTTNINTTTLEHAPSAPTSIHNNDNDSRKVQRNDNNNNDDDDDDDDLEEGEDYDEEDEPLEVRAMNRLNAGGGFSSLFGYFKRAPPPPQPQPLLPIPPNNKPALAGQIDAFQLPRWPEFYSKSEAKQIPAVSSGEAASLGGPFSTSLSEKVVLMQGDITKVKIQAIVNAANSGLWGGGGVCGAIHSAAGVVDMGDFCDKLGGCDTGDTAVTPGFRLPAQYVLHSVGPTNGDGALLKKCYETCLHRCVQNNIRSVAFCCISTGIFGFSNREAAKIAISTVRRFLDSPVPASLLPSSSSSSSSLSSSSSSSSTPIGADLFDLIVFCTFLREDVMWYRFYLPYFFPVADPSSASPAATQ